MLELSCRKFSASCRRSYFTYIDEIFRRGGRAVRLTYDHKGSDVQEARRITDAGGFVMNNRVNGWSSQSFGGVVSSSYHLRHTGVLAVTRSLGDSSMKEFVVGSPYTTETTLGVDDQFLIVACDGVSLASVSLCHPDMS